MVDNGNGFEFVEEYEGNLEPFNVSVTGSRIRFVWNTDGSVTRSGFEINWTCISDNVAPIVNPMMELVECENTVLLSANSPNADQVLWDFGDGNTGEGMDVTHTYASTGIFQITATATNQFGETPFSLTATQEYKEAFFVTPDNMLIGETEEVSLLSPQPAQILLIEWYLDGVLISTDYSHTISFTEIGIYELRAEIIDIDGCNSEFERSIEVGLVNTQDLSIANIRIQPNPTRDFLQLLDLQNLPKDCTLSLYNTAVSYTHLTLPTKA